jgi:fatty acid desaturase
MENSSKGNYAELKRLIQKEGLLSKQPAYYALEIILTLMLLFASIAFLAIVDSAWLLIANAALLAFVFARIGFLGHDGGHNQIFNSVRKNDSVMLGSTFLLGQGRSWWVNRHNRHHNNPNDIDKDGDIEIAVLAFSEEQALKKKGIRRFVVKRQAYFFFPILCFAEFSLRWSSFRYSLGGRGKIKYRLAEPILLIAHTAIYLSLVFVFLNVWEAVLFIAVHQVLTGLYMGSVFATNHKGMPTLKNSNLNFICRQTLATRNVEGGLFTSFIYGGLNYQIEHHLFPTMPRNNLPKAKSIVMEHCKKYNLPYHETSSFGSFKEILQHFHRVSAVLRKPVGTS